MKAWPEKSLELQYPMSKVHTSMLDQQVDNCPNIASVGEKFHSGLSQQLWSSLSKHSRPLNFPENRPENDGQEGPLLWTCLLDDLV